MALGLRLGQFFIFKMGSLLCIYLGFFSLSVGQRVVGVKPFDREDGSLSALYQHSISLSLPRRLIPLSLTHALTLRELNVCICASVHVCICMNECVMCL